MLRYLLSSRWIQAGSFFCVLVVVGTQLYSWHVRRATAAELERTYHFLRALNNKKQTRPALETQPTETETPDFVETHKAAERTDIESPDATGTLPINITDAFLPDDIVSADSTAEEVSVSPYGFGPYPEVPKEMPTDTFPSPSADHELLARVRIKLLAEGINARGANLENGWVYPVIPGIVYVKWKEYERPDGIVRYIGSMLAHPSDGFRIREIRDEKGRAFTEADIPSDIKLMSFEEGAIDPYTFLGLPR